MTLIGRNFKNYTGLLKQVGSTSNVVVGFKKKIQDY